MKRIAVIGSFVVDLMARTPHLPVPGETVKGSFFRMGPGGKGYNQAVAAAKAGGNVFFSTKTGTDSFADILSDSMKDFGISDSLVFHDKENGTGIALISVDEVTSQNEIVVVSGACGTITEEEVNQMFQHLDGVEYLLIQLEINLDAIEMIIERAYSKGIRIILNPAPVQPVSDSILAKLYAITPNEVEAQILSSIAYDRPSDCCRIADYFMARGVQNAVITLGSSGVYAKTEEEERFLSNYKDIAVVDTTGAGDAFSGGLLAALGKGYDFMDAVEYANVVSNLSVTRIGTSPAMPSAAEIDDFIRTHKG